MIATSKIPKSDRERLAELDSEARPRLARALARMARRLHDQGLWHRDLHAGNVLSTPQREPEAEQLVLVDLQKLRVLPGPVPWPLRVRDLAFLLPGSPEEPETMPAQGIAEAYLEEPAARSVAWLAAAVERAAGRRRLRRLASRGRRCIVPSTGPSAVGRVNVVSTRWK